MKVRLKELEGEEFLDWATSGGKRKLLVIWRKKDMKRMCVCRDEAILFGKVFLKELFTKHWVTGPAVTVEEFKNLTN